MKKKAIRVKADTEGLARVADIANTRVSTPLPGAPVSMRFNSIHFSLTNCHIQPRMVAEKL